MTNNINTEITFELFGATYTRKANGYCYAHYNAETAKTHRISKAEFEARHTEYKMMDMTLAEVEAAEDPEVSVEQFCEMLAQHTEEIRAEEAIREFNEERAAEAEEATQSTEQVQEAASTPKAKKSQRKAKKNAAFRATIDNTEITLTEKQVDFFYHMTDTCFWENGLESCIWVDCLCDEIGGQFEGKPMTVGAMISTICEKGLGTRAKDRINGRKCTSFALTELGKKVTKILGLN